MRIDIADSAKVPQALVFLREGTEILIDPKIVDVFEKLVTKSLPDLLATE